MNVHIGFVQMRFQFFGSGMYTGMDELLLAHRKQITWLFTSLTLSEVATWATLWPLVFCELLTRINLSNAVQFCLHYQGILLSLQTPFPVPISSEQRREDLFLRDSGKSSCLVWGYS